MNFKLRNKHLSTFQVIIFGFLLVIFVGCILLMLPVSSKSRGATPFFDALFTAVSAVCVTGLVVVDTASYWSSFGQFIILLLIQIGGMGVVTVAVSVAAFAGKKIGLMQRNTMKEAISAPKVGGIVRLTGFIFRTTIIIELLGAVIMAPVFCRDFGIKGIWYAVFHSISAFCNAGFDLMGIRSPFSSLTSYSSVVIINIVIAALIITGGIGFITWDDVRVHKHHLKRYRMQSKVILLTSCILIIVPFLYFYFYEFSKNGWEDASLTQRVLTAGFQAVTPRTAGFNTMDLNLLSGAGKVIILILMLIGGSPGSTAGGMKTTTAAVLMFSAFAVFKRKENAHCFGRRISDDTVKNAAAILLMYIVLFLAGGIIISCIEDLPVLTCLFETASAIGTVGLSLGITPELGLVSRGILMLLMFFGRVGGLTLIFAALSGKNKIASKLPQERITVG